MGFLSKTKPGRPDLKRLPAGTFTVDSHGRILSSTIPSSVPEAQIKEIGRQIVAVFAGAREANLQFKELVVQYAAFKITARAMRDGAIIFLVPRALQSVAFS